MRSSLTSSRLSRLKKGWPLIHAGLLLCELRAESALPALQRAMSAPWGHDLADWLADDALEKFGPAALDMLEAVAADKTVEWYPRAVACRVMMIIFIKLYQSGSFWRGLVGESSYGKTFFAAEILQAISEDVG